MRKRRLVSQTCLRLWIFYYYFCILFIKDNNRPGGFGHTEQVRQPNEFDDDEPEFDYPPPEKRKQPPQMNLLKRSVSCTYYLTANAPLSGAGKSVFKTLNKIHIGIADERLLHRF